MFASGVIKYGERTWALTSASMSCFRSSLLPPPAAHPCRACAGADEHDGHRDKEHPRQRHGGGHGASVKTH